MSYLPPAMQYTIATQVELCSLTKDMALAYRERYEAGKPFEILMKLPDTMTESESQELSDTVTGSENQDPSDTVTRSENQELSDSLSGSKPLKRTLGAEDIECGLRCFGEESVFLDLVLRYLPEKEWSRNLKKSHWHIGTEKMDVACEAAGVTIRKGALVTVLSYHQAYDMISNLIRQGEWLSKPKMLELAKKYWEEN